MMKQLYKTTGSIIILTTIVLSVCSCRRIANKVYEIKECILSGIDEIFDNGFYTNPGGWDYIRLPLIAPYQLLSLDNILTERFWVLVIENDVNDTDLGTNVVQSARKTVETVGITDSVIYCRYSKELSPDYNDLAIEKFELAMERFIIVDTRCDSVMLIEEEDEFRNALEHLGVHEPVMYQVDSVYNDFLKNKKLLFYPAENK
ncbi:hypothetical protein [Bacteroides finegoldii]|uniref:hypothetical protein n=1 Tax=Bacteroides finegoldii TaxID=338188 RepID=UPI00189D8867|nr:hypothetical protein [Bacteroides finegoldii]